jgi:hypothetical protein
MIVGHKFGLGWYIGTVVVAIARWVGEVARVRAVATVALEHLQDSLFFTLYSSLHKY